MKKVTKKAKKEFLKNKLANDVNWAIKAMQKIYTFQTQGEKITKETVEHNDIGFSGCDAEILSSFCEQLSKGWKLSPKQMALVFKKMPKYWNQLLNVSDEAKLLKAMGVEVEQKEEVEEPVKEVEFDEYQAELVANGIPVQGELNLEC